MFARDNSPFIPIMRTLVLLLLVALLTPSRADAQSHWLQSRLKVPPLYKLVSVAAADSNDYVISGDHIGGVGIFRTTDGGDSWRTLFEFPIGGVLSFYQIAHPTPDIIVVAIDSQGSYRKDERTTVYFGAGSILNSTDGGATWSQTVFGTRDTSKPVKGIFSVHMKNERWGLAPVTSDRLHQTTDGGRTWIPYPSPNDNMNAVRAIDVRDSMHVVLMMSDALGKSWVFRTTTGGATWDSTQVQGTITFRDIALVNAHVGFAVAYDWDVNRGKVLRTNDGGLTWTSVMDTLIGYGDPYVTVDFLDEQRGVIAGRGGLVMRTEDGGDTWSREQVEYSQGVDMGAYFDVQYVAPTKVVMVGGDGFYTRLMPKALLPWPEFVVPRYGVPTLKSFTAQWKESMGAERYELYLVRNAEGWDTVRRHTDLTTNTLELNNLTDPSYFVQVRALSSDNQSNWSRVLFATNAVASVDPASKLGGPRIYPNPVSEGYINLDWEGAQLPAMISISDLLGRPMQSVVVNSPEDLRSIDVRSLHKGF